MLRGGDPHKHRPGNRSPKGSLGWRKEELRERGAQGDRGQRDGGQAPPEAGWPGLSDLDNGISSQSQSLYMGPLPAQLMKSSMSLSSEPQPENR